MLSQVLIANNMLAANEVNGIEGIDKSIEKSGKLLKTRKLFKLGKTKSQKLSKSQNLANLKKSSQNARIHLISVLKRLGHVF